jgi:hypothetical protein
LSDASESPDRQARDAILSFKVIGPESAQVRILVEQRDAAALWSPAGTLTVFAPATATLAVPALRDDARLRFEVVPGPDDALVEVRVLPPRWTSG